ncbi:MAG: heat-inducible transcriptional repressor HrcA [Actinomycetota bacterium]|nr:heat-inducible transcriptional repressor HrcA [Actinomycetota bacterium]
MKLTERKKEIIKQVVLRFIRDAEPVSSKSVASSPELNLSTATIRREMSELEEMGYLTHPHTSAGRVPTDEGYRYYVDNFLQTGSAELVPDSSLANLDLGLSRDMELDTILKKSSENLARITSYLSMVVAPAISQSKLRHIELLKLEGNNYLMVLITDNGHVYKRNFSGEGSYSNLDLQALVNSLNLQFKDKYISEIYSTGLKLPESESHLVLLAKRVMDLIRDYASEGIQYNRIFVHGTSDVLNQPEFIDLAKIRKVLRVIENEYMLMQVLLDTSKENEFIIKIGSEVFDQETDELSLVASKYKIHNQPSGAIGILGPKRMDYCKVINVINLFKVNLNEIFASRT